jgi:hypothetical protein
VAATKLLDVTIIVLAAAVLAALLIAYLYSFRYLFQYSLENDTIRVQLFGTITLRKIRIAEIDEAAMVDWKQMMPFSSSFKPSLLFSERWGGYEIGRGIALKKHSGVIRTIIISPKDPEKFVELINAAKSTNRRVAPITKQ